MLEAWKSIERHPGYEVSNLGRVRSLDRLVSCHKVHARKVRGQIRRTFVSRVSGYAQVAIQGTRHNVHRLVAEAFCVGRFESAVVNHKNGVRHDNRAENLEWTTNSENLRHAYRSLGVVNHMTGKFSTDHNTSKAVIATCMSTGSQAFYGAGMDAVRAGFRSDSISRCCNGKIAHHKGFFWRFATEAEIHAWMAEQEVAA